jgi:hypothetical protein
LTWVAFFLSLLDGGVTPYKIYFCSLLRDGFNPFGYSEGIVRWHCGALLIAMVRYNKKMCTKLQVPANLQRGMSTFLWLFSRPLLGFFIQINKGEWTKNGVNKSLTKLKQIKTKKGSKNRKSLRIHDRISTICKYTVKPWYNAPRFNVYFIITSSVAFPGRLPQTVMFPRYNVGT